MKNLYLIILTLLFASSCSGDEKTYKKYKHFQAKKSPRSIDLAFNDYKKIHSDVKFTYRIKPSESMAAGVGGNNKFDSLRIKNKEKITTKLINDDLDEIMVGSRYVGQYKVGNPYQIEEITYYPQEYDYYEEIGVASWYGDDFHGKSTANGEIYNSGSLTAAHQTLPLPSMVRVTNLDNGKNVVVRVNDRGPFAKSRIIDVSEQAAGILGFKGRGTANVKVEYLEKETLALLKTLNIKNQ